MRLSTNPVIQKALEAGRMSAPKPQSTGVEGSGNEDFAHMLMDVIEKVNTGQNDAKQVQEDFITNRRPVEVQDVMIAMEQASTQMQLTMSVRNKVLEAYQEITRMQV